MKESFKKCFGGVLGIYAGCVAVGMLGQIREKLKTKSDDVEEADKEKQNDES